jgi:glutathione S-transferase
MKLYITRTSPYARMVRIVIVEKELSGRVEIIAAETRIPDSPYYAVNPSGRVPYLVLDDGGGMEESALICAYLDHIDGVPDFDPPPGEAGWELRRLEALARSTMDGLAVLGRELMRPEEHRSPLIIEHEKQRRRRMLDLWEGEIDHPLMGGALNMAQISLICALQMVTGKPDFQWPPEHAKLAAWAGGMAERPSIAATRPLAGA